MRPIILTMTAFGPYVGKEVVDFRDAVASGLFGIYGSTGSGKSSIFSAITFALFGEASRSDQEASSLRSRRHTLLPLDDCLYALQDTIPKLSRSVLHRCLQRHGISRLPKPDENTSKKKKFKTYAIGYLHIDIAEVRTEAGKL